MNLEIIDAYPDKEEEHCDGLLKRCAEAVFAYLGIEMDVDVTVMLVDDTNIQEINRQTRQIDAHTDVLSFPLLDIDPGDLKGSLLAGAGDTDPETGALMLGDIVISLDAVKRQADEYGHSFDRELGYLTVHGMLHLLGYDHKHDGDKRNMRGAEDAVMEALGLFR